MKLLFSVPLFVAILAAQEHPLVFTHVTVIDATGQPAAKDRTVVVVNRRIELIGTSGKTQVPKGAVVVDGTGRFLIPGLWDMHIHLRGGAVQSVAELDEPGNAAARQLSLRGRGQPPARRAHELALYRRHLVLRSFRVQHDCGSRGPRENICR